MISVLNRKTLDKFSRFIEMPGRTISSLLTALRRFTINLYPQTIQPHNIFVVRYLFVVSSTRVLDLY